MYGWDRDSPGRVRTFPELGLVPDVDVKPVIAEAAAGPESPRLKAPSFRDGTLSNTVTSVKVGPDADIFVAHRDLLSYWSPRFRAILEGRPTELKLRDVDPKTFRVFLDWMYSETFPIWNEHKPTGEKHTEPVEVDDDEELEDLEAHYRKQPEADALDAYIFAHTYEIRLLKNDLFDIIHGMNPDTSLVPSYSIVLKVWSHLPANSPLRKYLIAIFAHNWDEETDVGYREELILRKRLPATFLVPLMIRKARGFLDDVPPWKEDRCQYHEHEGKERKACWWPYSDEAHEESLIEEEDDLEFGEEYESDGINDGEIEDVDSMDDDEDEDEDEEAMDDGASETL